jgi:hypothetical protein
MFELLDQGGQKQCGQIVNAEITGILQHIECHGFTGTRHSANQYQLHDV